MTTLFREFTLKNISVALIGGFFAVQISSVLLNMLFPKIPLLKGGSVILLILLAVAVITLFIIGIKVDELRRKENLIFILIIFALVALAYWKLPEVFPQLFTIDPSISSSIKSTIGSIFG